ncbi:efflux RND transporter periplasmic adaptor subunit [Paenibacillus hodogayensis]|uniref:Efflux RND transporter periplasmic adaptor subunit n=1 Tax=Paenibacillus hodogayensis TaxID=279208 RepID=A0ABV5W608_9BACL
MESVEHQLQQQQQPLAASVHKRAVRNVITAFAFLMVALTLFSNTLLHFSLPQVIVEQAAPGFLSHDVTGTGTVEVAEIADLNLDTRWTVDQVFVKVGDRVTAGQTIATFRTADARSTLLDEEARYEQKKLSIGKLQDGLIEAERNGNALQSRSVERDLESAKLDLQIQERKLKQLRGQLEQGAALVSSVSGTVVELNASAGLAPQSGRPIARVTDEAKGFQFVTTVDASKAKYVSVGDEVEVVVSSLHNARLKGRLDTIRDPVSSAGSQTGKSASASSSRKELIVVLNDDRLTGGEEGELFASKKMPSSRQLVSNAAVREDDGGKYVLVLKEKKGPLGSEFYAQRAAVTIPDSDDHKAEIASGISPIDKVIVTNSKPVQDGDRVMMAQ